MKNTLVFATSIIAVGALAYMPTVYKKGYDAGAASASPTSSRSEATEPFLQETADDPSKEHPATKITSTSPSKSAHLAEKLTGEVEAPLSYEARISALTAKTSIEDALALWSEIDSLPLGSSRKRNAFKFLKRFGETHGEDAFLSSIADSGPNALRRLGPLAAGWAKTQPTEAWAALLAASNNGAIRAVDLGFTIREVSRTDLRTALDMVNDLQGNRRSKEFHSLLSQQKSTSGFETLLEGSLEIASKNIQEKSLVALFDAWSDFDFDGSLSAIEQLHDPTVAKSSMHGFLNSWAERDGSEAFAYTLANQSDPNVDGALLDVTKNWLRSSTSFETKEVFDAISSMPDRDRAIYNLSADLVAANPDATMSMVASINDAELRNRTYSKAASYWSRNDIDEAEAFALTHEDEISKAAMLSTLSRRRLENGGSLDVYANAIEQIEGKRERQRILIGLRRNAETMGARVSEEQLIEVKNILARHAGDMDNVTFMPDGRVRVRTNRTQPVNVTPKP